MEQHTIEALTTLSQTDVFVTPQVFDMDVTEDVRALESLLHAGCVRVVHDVYVEQLEELFLCTTLSWYFIQKANNVLNSR
jgi:hypothetical protein